MLIASICLIAVFLVFIVVTYFMTMKKVELIADEKKFKITNRGSKLAIFINDSLVAKDDMPQLIDGEEYNVKHEGKAYLVKCKSNSFGNVFKVEIFKDGQKLAENRKTKGNQ
jgi:hypothetical protein